MAGLMTEVAEQGISVVLSSHVVLELERIADYLVVLSSGQLQVDGTSKSSSGSTGCSPDPQPTAAGGHKLSSKAATLVSYRLDDFKGHAGAWLREHHLVYLISYQPGGRFWLFQGIEAAMLVGSAALFGWMTLRLVRLRS